MPRRRSSPRAPPRSAIPFQPVPQEPMSSASAQPRRPRVCSRSTFSASKPRIHCRPPSRPPRCPRANPLLSSTASRSPSARTFSPPVSPTSPITRCVLPARTVSSTPRTTSHTRSSTSAMPPACRRASASLMDHSSRACTSSASALDSRTAPVTLSRLLSFTNSPSPAILISSSKAARTAVRQTPLR